MTIVCQKYCTAPLIALLLTAAASGQTDSTEPASTARKSNLDLSATVGYSFQFDTNMTGPGDFDVSRFDVGVRGRTHLSREVDLNLYFGYSFDYYTFDKETDFGQDVWEGIHTFDFGATFDFAMSSDWSFFIGPLLRVSGESGADISDAFTAGGTVGATWRASRSLLIGGGVGVMDQLQDDVRLFPVIVVDWEIAKDLRLTSRTRGVTSGVSGVELIYSMGEGWEIGFGAAYEFNRFRLDEDSKGPAPDGVGQDESLPVWFRATYQINDHFTITGYAGFRLEGELEVEQADGDRPIPKRDYEPGPFIGVNANIQF